MHRDNNGMLVIDNAEQIIAQANQYANNAKAAAIMGGTTASKAALVSEKTNTKRQFAEYEGSYQDEDYDETAAARNKIRNEIIDNAENYGKLTKKEFNEKITEKGLILDESSLDKFYTAI